MLLASTSHILNQNLIMICFPHIQALCDIPPDSLHASDVMGALLDRRLENNEPLGVILAITDSF